MGQYEDADQVVANPTYMADIRFFFRPIDIDHMGGMGIELGTYDGVKRNALQTWGQVAGPKPSMPPARAGGPWSAERQQTFKNWIANGYPLGSAPPGPPPPPTAERIRKNVTTLSDDE